MFVLPTLSFVPFYNLVILIIYCDLLSYELWILLYLPGGIGASKLSPVL